MSIDNPVIFEGIGRAGGRLVDGYLNRLLRACLLVWEMRGIRQQRGGTRHDVG